jgi:hypothetical protein
MKEKVLFVAFNGGDMSGVHVFLNALEMKEKGFDVKIMMEGGATKHIKGFADSKSLFSSLYAKVKKDKLIDCVCKTCAEMTGALESAKAQGLKICDDMEGHPPISRYVENGYKAITF